MSPDKLRMNETAVAFVKAFFDAGKPVGAIRHAPWSLIKADVMRGKTLTSRSSLKTDLENAGAKWVDETVVTDNGLRTSRNPQYIPAFNEKIIEEFAEGVIGDVNRRRNNSIQNVLLRLRAERFIYLKSSVYILNNFWHTNC